MCDHCILPDYLMKVFQSLLPFDIHCATLCLNKKVSIPVSSESKKEPVLMSLYRWANQFLLAHIQGIVMMQFVNAFPKLSSIRSHSNNRSFISSWWTPLHPSCYIWLTTKPFCSFINWFPSGLWFCSILSPEAIFPLCPGSRHSSIVLYPTCSDWREAQPSRQSLLIYYTIVVILCHALSKSRCCVWKI